MGNEEIMTIPHTIKTFIIHLEQFANRKFEYSNEISELLNIAEQNDRLELLEDLIFQAKFAVKTQDVMKRIGPGSEPFEKLASEFQHSIRLSMELIQQLVGSSEVEEKFNNEYLRTETESFSKLLKLLSELLWLKNWQVDGRPLPYEKRFAEFIRNYVPVNNSVHTAAQKDRKMDPNRILKSIVLCTLLYLIFLLVDPPISTLGLILSLGILGLLAYISIEVHYLIKSLKK